MRATGMARMPPVALLTGDAALARLMADAFAAQHMRVVVSPASLLRGSRVQVWLVATGAAIIIHDVGAPRVVDDADQERLYDAAANLDIPVVISMSATRPVMLSNSGGRTMGWRRRWRAWWRRSSVTCCRRVLPASAPSAQSISGRTGPRP